MNTPTPEPLEAPASSASFFALLEFATQYAFDNCFELNKIEWWPLVAAEVGLSNTATNEEIGAWAKAKLESKGWELHRSKWRWIIPPTSLSNQPVL